MILWFFGVLGGLGVLGGGGGEAEDGTVFFGVLGGGETRVGTSVLYM